MMTNNRKLNEADMFNEDRVELTVSELYQVYKNGIKKEKNTHQICPLNQDII